MLDPGLEDDITKLFVGQRRRWLTGSVGALIVGGGAAAAACAESLHEGGFGEGVLLVGREPDPPYERPPCSKEYLAGKQDRDACLLHDADWYSRNGIELATRTSVMKLDTAARTATLSTKEVVEFGVALLATGANVRRLRVDGAQLSGIHYLRTLGTSDAIRADADQAERVVLIGGSYIACEVAATLTARGQHCTLVMLEDAPLSTTFGPAAGAFFADVLRSHGVELVTGDGLERLEGAERVERVVTASGRELPADMVVDGHGRDARRAARPRRRAGARRVGRRRLRRAPGDVGAGRVRRRRHVRVGLRAARGARRGSSTSRSRRRRAARPPPAMLGARKPFAEVPYFWTDLADWASAEWVGLGAPSEREVVRGDPGAGAFSVLHVAGGRVIGALSVERGADLESARRLIAEKTDVGEAAARRRRPRGALAGRAHRALALEAQRVAARAADGERVLRPRPGAQQPLAVGAALDRAAGDQLTQPRRHRRAAGADHPGERAVREPQRDDDAVRHHAAPALGQAPEQGEQAVVDARQVRDRLQHDEPLGAAAGAVEQRREDLRPLREPDGQRLVDDRDPGRGERAPLGRAREQLLGVVVGPRADEVARAEQLGGGVVADGRLADHQALEDQQPERARAAGEARAGVPAAARDVDDADGEPLGGVARAARVEPAREVGVRIEELDGGAAAFRH